MVQGEDLVRLNGGSGSSEHFVWGHRAQQDRPELGRSYAQQATPYQCSHPIINSLPSRESAQDVAQIAGDVVIFRYATNKPIRHVVCAGALGRVKTDT